MSSRTLGVPNCTVLLWVRKVRRLRSEGNARRAMYDMRVLRHEVI